MKKNLKRSEQTSQMSVIRVSLEMSKASRKHEITSQMLLIKVMTAWPAECFSVEDSNEVDVRNMHLLLRNG